MRKLYRVVAYNLAKSRAARDGDRFTRRRYHPKPRFLKAGTNVLVRDKTTKAFKPAYQDFAVVDMVGKNQVMVKDNPSHETKVSRKDVKVVHSDIKIAELIEEFRKTGIRDAQYYMLVKQIPDLEWKDPDDINPEEDTKTVKVQIAAVGAPTANSEENTENTQIQVDTPQTNSEPEIPLKQVQKQ